MSVVLERLSEETIERYRGQRFVINLQAALDLDTYVVLCFRLERTLSKDELFSEIESEEAEEQEEEDGSGDEGDDSPPVRRGPRPVWKLLTIFLKLTGRSGRL